MCLSISSSKRIICNAGCENFGWSPASPCGFRSGPEFRVDAEPTIVPVRIVFGATPSHLFEKTALFSIASAVGTPLRLATSTATRSRLQMARVCVEVDLEKELPKRVRISRSQGTKDGGFWQSISYDNLPAYCSACSRQGHKREDCKIKPMSGPGLEGISAKKHTKPRDVNKTTTPPLEGQQQYREEQPVVNTLLSSPEAHKSLKQKEPVSARHEDDGIQEIVEIQSNTLMETEEERNVVEEPRQLVIRESDEKERQQLVRREDRRDSMQLQEPKEMGWTSVSEKGKEIVVRNKVNAKCSKGEIKKP
ncbi:hypothetical protein HPP92_008755 [Vanilla planifolia]|uniref:Uncharacterized protein n=1 Tax=Vanilla planifolia TaxID=51239 RepID=A0A835V6B2_VANPL|nr:hypothetical protein HPP92_008755 [Vanilla planifolia]